MGVVVKSRIEEGIGVLTLADEARANVLSPALVEQAQAVHREFIHAGVRVAVLEAQGPAFCSGRDPEAARVPGIPPAGAVFIDEIEQSPLAWVATVDGSVVGAGIHLVTTCMHVITSPNARFVVPELLAGIYPRPVAAELAKIVGPRQTMRLLLTGEALTAGEAVAMGLASETVPAAELAARGWERARALDALPAELLATTREGWRGRFGTAPGAQA